MKRTSKKNSIFLLIFQRLEYQQVRVCMQKYLERLPILPYHVHLV